MDIKKKRRVKTNGQFHEVVSTKVRDCSGTYGTISFWDKYTSYAKIEKVYKITNVKLENFPEMKPHFMNTTSKTSITDVTLEENDNFKNITLYDEIHGQYEASSDIKCYPSCRKCNTSVAEKAICWKCKDIVKDALPNFVFTLYLKVDEDYQRFYGFMSVLDKFALDFTNEPKEIEDILNEYFEEKMIKIIYMEKEDAKDEGKLQKQIISLDFTEKFD